MDNEGVNKWTVWRVLVLVAIMPPVAAWANPAVNVMQGAPEVHPYDYAEVVLQVQGCAVKNPFRETSLKGSFQPANGGGWDLRRRLGPQGKGKKETKNESTHH